jgi:hypothetical protein
VFNGQTAERSVSVCVGCILVLISDRGVNENLMKRKISKEEEDEEKVGRKRSTSR